MIGPRVAILTAMVWLIVASTGCGVVKPPERTAVANIALFNQEFRAGEKVVIALCLGGRCTTIEHVMKADAPAAEFTDPQFASVTVDLIDPDGPDDLSMGHLSVSLELRGPNAREVTTGEAVMLTVEARVDAVRVIRDIERQVVFDQVPLDQDCDCWWIDESIP